MTVQYFRMLISQGNTVPSLMTAKVLDLIARRSHLGTLIDSNSLSIPPHGFEWKGSISNSLGSVGCGLAFDSARKKRNGEGERFCKDGAEFGEAQAVAHVADSVVHEKQNAPVQAQSHWAMGCPGVRNPSFSLRAVTGDQGFDCWRCSQRSPDG